MGLKLPPLLLCSFALLLFQGVAGEGDPDAQAPLQEKLQLAEARLAASEKRVTATDAELRSLKIGAEKLKEDGDKAAKLQAKVKELEDQLAQGVTKRAALEGENTALKRAAEAAKKNNEVSSAASFQQKVNSLEKEVAELQKVKEQHAQLQALVGTLEGEKKDLVDKLRAAEELLEEVKESKRMVLSTAEKHANRAEAAEKAHKAAEARRKQLEAELAAKQQEFQQALESWLPHWAAQRLAPLQEQAFVHWATTGQPLLHAASKKMSGTAAAGYAAAKPHLDSASKVTAEAWSRAQSAAQPALAFARQTSQKYGPVVTAEYQEHLAPHVTVARQAAAQQWARVAAAAAPHLATLRAKAAPHLAAAQPYVKPVQDTLQPAVAAAQDLHHQTHGWVKDALLKAELAAHETVDTLAHAVVYGLTGASLLLFFSALAPVFGLKSAAKEAVASKKPKKPRKKSVTGEKVSAGSSVKVTPAVKGAVEPKPNPSTSSSTKLEKQGSGSVPAVARPRS